MSYGFTNWALENRVYFFRKCTSFIIIALVIDDMALASNDKNLLQSFKKTLQNSFDVSFFGDLKAFLGWRIARTTTGIRIDQELYAKHLIKSHGMIHSNNYLTGFTIKANTRRRQDNEEPLNSQRHSQYRSLVGGLLYLATSTRSDLLFPVGVLARQMHKPNALYATYK